MRYRLRTLLILLAVLPPVLALLAWGGATLVERYRVLAAPPPPPPTAKFWPGMTLMDREGNMIHVSSDGTRASGVPALIDLLQHESPGIRVSAANWLGSIGSDAQPGLPALQKMHTADADADVRRAAAAAIGQIGTPTP